MKLLDEVGHNLVVLGDFDAVAIELLGEIIRPVRQAHHSGCETRVGLLQLLDALAIPVDHHYVGTNSSNSDNRLVFGHCISFIVGVSL